MRWNTAAPIVGTIVSPDANPITVQSFDVANGQNKDGVVSGPILNDCIFHVQALLLGQQGSNRVRLYAERSFSVAAGVLAALDLALLAPLANFASAQLSTCAITLDNSGTAVRLRPSGVIATSITWTGYLWLFTGEISG